jgi:ribokinase
VFIICHHDLEAPLMPTSARPHITIIGDIGIDLVMGPIDQWPAVGTETLMERSELRAGGSGGNAAMALRSLGTPCKLIATHGDDPLGQWLAAQFSGMDASLATIPGSATSLSVGIIHACGERSFLTTRGHLETTDWSQLRARLDLRPPAGSIALLTGAFLMPQLTTHYEQIITQLHEAGYRVAIDTGWPSGGWGGPLRTRALGWLQSCDHVLLNEAEIVALADEPDLRAAMLSLGSLLPPRATLVAKMGAKGAMALQEQRFHLHGAPVASVFDTIGAGDAFNAGYLEARLQSDDIPLSLRAGCTAATTIIARFPRRDIAPGELRRA